MITGYTDLLRLRWGHRSRLAELPWPIANAGPSGRGQYFQALVKIKKKKNQNK